jgi:hypothetical protein
MTVTPLGNYELKLDLSIPSVIDEEGHDDQVEQTGAQRFYEEGFAPAETAKSPAGRGSEVDFSVSAYNYISIIRQHLCKQCVKA